MKEENAEMEWYNLTKWFSQQTTDQDQVTKGNQLEIVILYDILSKRSSPTTKRLYQNDHLIRFYYISTHQRFTLASPE